MKNFFLVCFCLLNLNLISVNNYKLVLSFLKTEEDQAKSWLLADGLPGEIKERIIKPFWQNGVNLNSILLRIFDEKKYTKSDVEEFTKLLPDGSCVKCNKMISPCENFYLEQNMSDLSCSIKTNSDKDLFDFIAKDKVISFAVNANKNFVGIFYLDFVEVLSLIDNTIIRHNCLKRGMFYMKILNNQIIPLSEFKNMLININNEADEIYAISYYKSLSFIYIEQIDLKKMHNLINHFTLEQCVLLYRLDMRLRLTINCNGLLDDEFWLSIYNSFKDVEKALINHAFNLEIPGCS